ncbi:MAG: hypothetical protein ACOCRK_12075 [bacterium]
MYDDKSIRKVMGDINRHTVKINQLVEEVIDFEELDNYIKKVENKLQDNDMLSDNELEKITLRLPIYIYWAIEKLETIGIKNDLGELIKQEKYSDSFTNNEGTVKDKENQAELDSLEEEIVEKAYYRAYKKLKGKIRKADGLYKATKKILNKRTAEIDFSKMTNSFGDSEEMNNKNNQNVSRENNNDDYF